MIAVNLGGAVVNCSSIGGLGLTTSAALATQGIRVNAICPLLFDTPMSDRMKAAGQSAALDAMFKEVPIRDSAGRERSPTRFSGCVVPLRV